MEKSSYGGGDAKHVVELLEASSHLGLEGEKILDEVKNKDAFSKFSGKEQH